MNRAGIRAAIYARVSSDQQAKNDTIASQVEALRERVGRDGLDLDPEMTFVDEGYSGGSLVRPALERLRDQAAAGALDRLYVLAPDRLARRYAYQVLLVDELHRCGVEVVFLDHPPGRTPEEELLLQVQGMVAEYERAKILERRRRGKRHAARRSSVSFLTNAPYGFRYISRQDGGGQARYEIIPEQARVVVQIFTWVGVDRCSLAEVGRRLRGAGVHTRTGKAVWSRTALWGLLRNPAYKGEAAFGRPRVPPVRQQLRPGRGRPEHPRRRRPPPDPEAGEPITIPVPAIVDEALFAAAREQLEENRARSRTGPRGPATCSRACWSAARAATPCVARRAGGRRPAGRNGLTPTTAAAGPSRTGSGASGSAGAGRSAATCSTRPSGRTCGRCCRAPSGFGTSMRSGPAAGTGAGSEGRGS